VPPVMKMRMTMKVYLRTMKVNEIILSTAMGLFYLELDRLIGDIMQKRMNK